jgi:hypothetical protein
MNALVPSRLHRHLCCVLRDCLCFAVTLFSCSAQDIDLIKDELGEVGNILDSFKIELKNQSPSDKKVYKGVRLSFIWRWCSRVVLCTAAETQTTQGHR